MASITASCSSSSLQLRLALNGRNRRKLPTILQSRVGGKWNDRRVRVRFRVLCVAQDGARNGSGLERAASEGSWVKSSSSDSKIDGFSGWSNSEEEEQQSTTNSPKKPSSYKGEGIS